ncbi:immunoglobulin superfamily member 8 [Dicentrarchus labrax]|uniref:immunoglobulin superfamily member 8 n=1 Tax=Dicentrarchus labrax TaxID=13489 RepID=UPI0021F59B05|nr:immunoglobulin superfamily member 8 [Dicentrarchus labrax]
MSDLRCIQMSIFLILLLHMTGGCMARVVTVSPGPLIRVEGQPVSIRCEVKEYSGPREQDFEWMMSRDANGKMIKIISTFDASFTSSLLKSRVEIGNISMVRLQENMVELKIAEVKVLDSGFYWCETPSTDSFISGNYKAQVQLIVKPNTLRVSPQTPPSFVLEGSDITLPCKVTQELTHNTYLSITWLVKKGATPEEILTFGPQLDVVVGQKFAWRFANGGIRLVPVSYGLYELVISRVNSSDEGVYACNGAEWTHETGGEWIKIVESTIEMGNVSVNATDVDATRSTTQEDCSVLTSIMFVMRVAELLLITVITVLLIRARGNQRPPDDKSVNNDDNDGVVNYENCGETSTSVRLH